MEKLSNSLLRAIVTVFLLIQCVYSYGQTVTKTTSSPIAGAVCPVTVTEYSVSIPNGFQNCSRLWTATNGQIEGSATGTAVKVKWNDSPGASGRVTCTFSNCGNSNDNTAPFLEELILSIKNQAWGYYGNSVNVDYCTKAQVLITMPRMFVLGTGGIAQPPLTEVAYAWTLPSGWKETGTNKTGFFGTPTNYITIEPIECAKPGAVTVYGTLEGAGPFCNLSASSATATISLNGANPVVTVGPQLGYFGGTACNTNPVTFYATTNVALGCITSYNWIYPSSWSIVSQNGNTITLSPSGLPADSNPIRATVNFSCGSSITSGNYTPPYIAPVISGPILICNEATYSIQNTNGVSVNWSSSDSNILTINSSGQASRVGSNSGYVTINAILPCAAPVESKLIWVGEPTITYYPPGFNPCFDNPYYQGPNINGLYYTWSVDNQNVWFTSANSSYTTAVISNNPEYFNIALTITDGNCTLSSTLFTYTAGYYCQCFFDPTCGGFGFARFTTTPNPTDEQLLIEFEEQDFKNQKNLKGEVNYSIAIIDNEGNEKLKSDSDKMIQIIDTSKLPSGTYYLKIIYDGDIETRRILIKH